MPESKRYIQIHPELTLLRETHRLVLSWQQLSVAPYRSYLVSLHTEDLRELGTALEEDAVTFASLDGELRIRGDANELTLRFQRRGEADEATLAIGGDARRNLTEAVARWRPRDRETP